MSEELPFKRCGWCWHWQRMAENSRCGITSARKTGNDTCEEFKPACFKKEDGRLRDRCCVDSRCDWKNNCATYRETSHEVW